MQKFPFNRRVLHVDATGRLVFVPNYMHKYNQILTYVFIVQDIEKLSNETSSVDNNYLLLSETSTSKHDTAQLSKMFLNLKMNYQSLYPTDNLFYMVTLDLSWASIHAATNILNNKTFTEYNNRVFRMAKGDKTAFIPSKVLLASCLSHTMHRFTRSLNKKKIFKADEKEYREFGVFCFSLMANCTTLEAIGNIFKLMCITFGTSCEMTAGARKAKI